MEISEVRKQVRDTIERAKRRATERRARTDEAGRAFEQFLEHTAIPLLRQIANVLRIETYPFTLVTPGGSARLASDRHAGDFIEIVLDTGGDRPQIVVHSSRARGRRIVESERSIGDPAAMTEEDLLAAVLEELEPFVER